jgi:hypothetical protein
VSVFSIQAALKMFVEGWECGSVIKHLHSMLDALVLA